MSFEISNMTNLTKYKDRTPESIKQELDSFTEAQVLELAKFLEGWMSNEYNGKQFLKLFRDLQKNKTRPSSIARQLLGYALDWFAYGN